VEREGQEEDDGDREEDADEEDHVMKNEAESIDHQAASPSHGIPPPS
jgi:hypothetical protein